MPTSSPPKAKINQNKKAGTSTQSCPLENNTKQPCDVGNLELIFVDSSGGSHKASTTDTRYNRATPVKPSDFPYLEDDKYINVAFFDSILEVIAPILSTDTTDVKKATFSASVSQPIGTCPKSYHPKISMRNSGAESNDGLSKASKSWVNQSIVPMDIYGKSMPVDNQVGKIKLRDVLYFFENSRKPNHVKDIFVEAKGCGVRDDGQAPNTTIKGLIRVYREDKYVLEVSIPSVVSKNASFKKETNINGEVTETIAQWGGDTTDTAKYGKNGNLSELSESDAGHFVNNTVSLDSNDYQLESSKKVGEFAKLTRNGRQLGAIDTINKVIKARKLIVDGFSFIDELKKAVPQVGFGWSFKLDVLAGTIGGEWGIEAGTNHDIDAYKFVEPYGQINLAMSLLKLEFEAFFGVQCTSPSILNWFKNPAYEIVAKISIKVTLDCKVEANIRLVGKDDANKVNKIGKEGSSNPADSEKVLWINSVTSQGEFSGQFKVNVVGYGMDTKAGVVASLTAEFKVVKPFRIRGSAKRNEAYLYAYFTHAKRRKSPPWKKILCKEKMIMTERYIFD